MITITKGAAILGMFVCGGAGLGLVAAGCGGDDTTGALPDAQVDGTVDVTVDQTTDTTTDTTISDVKASDVTADTPSNDAGADVIGDADANIVPADGAALTTFIDQVDLTFCERLASCCGLDGGTFDINADNESCAYFERIGTGPFGNIGLAVTSSGNIDFDPTSAAACLNDMANIPCANVASLTSAEFRQYTTDCAGALVGTVGLDAGPCLSSFDCQSPGYCAITADGGVCVPVKAIGQTCTETTTGTDCSYLGNGTPAAYCLHTATGSTCQASLPDDAGCSGVLSVSACASLVCDYSADGGKGPYVCSNTTLFGFPSVCSAYPIPDAGHD
jgi:hypothetical protein